METLLSGCFCIRTKKFFFRLIEAKDHTNLDDAQKNDS